MDQLRFPRCSGIPLTLHPVHQRRLSQASLKTFPHVLNGICLPEVVDLARIQTGLTFEIQKGNGKWNM